MHEVRSRRAIIVGGSLGGLLAGHQLRSIGWDVDIFERTADDLADRGAGIGTHPALFTAMRRAGLSLDIPDCTVPRSYVCLDKDDRLIHEAPARRTMTAWSRLYRPLRDNLPAGSYHNGMLLERIETEERGVTAIFANGSRVAADLLIGADGFRSTVRGQMLPALKPAYAGYVAWRALVPERDLSPATWAAIKDIYVFCVPEGELLVSYAVPTRDEDRAKGGLSYNIVWYRPANNETLADFCTDTSGQSHEFSIPPPLIRPQVISEMRASARALLAPSMVNVIERAEQPFFQPIYDLASPQLAIGRVVLLGDAAFLRARTSAPGLPRRHWMPCVWQMLFAQQATTSMPLWRNTITSSVSLETGVLPVGAGWACGSGHAIPVRQNPRGASWIDGLS